MNNLVIGGIVIMIIIIITVVVLLKNPTEKPADKAIVTIPASTVATAAATGSPIVAVVPDGIISACKSTDANGGTCSNILRGGKYSFNVAGDGNMGMRSGEKEIWYSGPNDWSRTPFKLRMQSDGNLVEYDAKDRSFWASDTAGKGVGPYTFVMQDDGNANIIDSKNLVTWSSNTKGT